MAKDKSTASTPTRDWGKWREGIFIVFSLIVSSAVAGVTGWGSWMHIVHIGHAVGEPSADWLPVAIDGMMLNGTILIAVDRFRKRVARFWAVVSLWLGTIMTLGFNIASAFERGLAAMFIAACFAIALLCTVEAVFHPSQTTIEEALARRTARRAIKAAATAVQIPAPLAPPVVAVAAPVQEVPVPLTVAPVPVAAPVAAPKPPRKRRAAPKTSARGPVQSTRNGRTAPAVTAVEDDVAPVTMAEPTVITFSDPPPATVATAGMVPDDRDAMAMVNP
jgi:hypothetical protein